MLRQFPVGSFLLVTLLSLFLPGCTEDQLTDLNVMERNLMLSWIALEREDDERFREFSVLVQRDWLTLTRDYKKVPMRPEVRQSIGRVDFWMGTLRNAAATSHHARGKMAINLIQNELRGIRPRYGIYHPADQLYDFYFQWQDVVAASNDPMVCLLEWNEYEALYELADKTWQNYLTTRPPYADELFPGYGERAAATETAGIALSRRLDYFATLLAQGDHTLAAEPSRIIDDLFFDYLGVITAYPVDYPPTDEPK